MKPYQPIYDSSDEMMRTSGVVAELERENAALRSTLRNALEFVSKFTSGNSVMRDVRSIAVRSGPTIAQEATFLRDQINAAMNGANT